MTDDECRRVRIERGRWVAAKREARRHFPARLEGESDAARLRTLLNLLDSPDEWHRGFATVELEQIVKTLRPEEAGAVAAALSAALLTGGPAARRAAVGWLWVVRSSVETTVLIAALADDLPEVRAHAISALGERRDRDAFDAVLACLADHDPAVFRMAIRTLPALDRERALPCLQNAAISRDWRVRAEALAALADYAEPAIVELARQGLRDSKRPVREAAKAALAAFDLRRRGMR